MAVAIVSAPASPNAMVVLAVLVIMCAFLIFIFIRVAGTVRVQPRPVPGMCVANAWADGKVPHIAPQRINRCLFGR
ncbi:MAG TPA: hypothetical protein VK281_14285 [Xanthobacteraceae bacterium]|nr:hypothetical protein [Xanthobacteraceae bacterium]